MSETTLTKGEIHTTKGVLTFELYDDDAPIAVANFKKLISQGFYDGLSFHRVIPNFMVQVDAQTEQGLVARVIPFNVKRRGVNKFMIVAYYQWRTVGQTPAGPNFLSATTGRTQSTWTAYILVSEKSWAGLIL